jgi:hypothetical protein
MKTRPHLFKIPFFAHTRRLPPLALLFLLAINLLLAGCQPKVMTITIAEAGESSQIMQEGQDPFQAQIGQNLHAGDELLVPPGETIKLELSDGSIVRLSGGTILQLLALDQEGQAARFQLHRGAVWIILAGEEIEVQALSGNAIVRGSYMSVSAKDLVGQVTEVTCLEGHCELNNAQGSTVLGDGQATTISSPQEAPALAQPMGTDQYAAWSEASPEAVSLVGDRGGNVSSDTDDGRMVGPNTWNTLVVTDCDDIQMANEYVPCFPVHFENNCRGGEQGGDIGTWNWYFEAVFGSYPPVYSHWFAPGIHVLPGRSYTGVLPALTYNVVSYSNVGVYNTYDYMEWRNQTFTADSSINVLKCPDEPPLPTDALTEPLRYELENNCLTGSSDPQANTVWHWSFTQTRGATLDDLILRDPIEVTLAPGEFASGELAPGIWIERDWTENGSVDNSSSLRIGGFDQVRLCPDDPPLNQP